MTDAPLAIALSGGGARAAYQVGTLRFLARRFPDLRVPILTGVSAGAINAAHLAACSGTFEASTVRLAAIWRSITTERVFRVDPMTLAANVLRWGARLVSGGAHVTPATRGLVDTAPLHALLHEVFGSADGALPGIARNLAEGRLHALGVTTTSYATGQSITWCQARRFTPWRRPHRKGIAAEITLHHVLASAALPLFFPAVRVGPHWHGDGGIRLTAPLAPALHLGAGRILAISTRAARTEEEADRPTVEGYPPPAQVLGHLLNAVFLDMLDQDALQMRRINALVEALPPGCCDGLRSVRLLMIRPSIDLGRLAGAYEADLPRSFRFLARGLGTRETRSPDALSMLLFVPGYLRRLIELGEQDAEAQADAIVEFVRG